MNGHLPWLEIGMIDIVRKRKGRVRFCGGIFGHDIFLNQQIDERLRNLSLIQ
jgi:hypothetical protein